MILPTCRITDIRLLRWHALLLLSPVEGPNSLDIRPPEKKPGISPAMFLIALLLSLLLATASAQSPSTAGFINIDCGVDDVSNYTQKDLGLVFSSDKPYISTGVNYKVSAETNLSGVSIVYQTLRSFPDGVRNCYTLPVTPGSKYRIVAESQYGNYDSLRRPPEFDLYLGVNYWVTMQAREFNRFEIIVIAETGIIQVCLVNTGKGIPFISVLYLRPLDFSMYNPLNQSSSAIVFDSDRINFGTNALIRFPTDIYDRFWVAQELQKTESTTQSVTLINDGEFSVPETVLQTASMSLSLSDSIDITTSGGANDVTFIYLYFTELRQLQKNETREISIYVGESIFSGPFKPPFLQQYVVYTLPPGGDGGLTYSIRATSNSTLPPIINAVESFRLIKLPLLPTNQGEVKAISDLKILLGVSRNWEGDPCVPRAFMWKGLECQLEALNYSTITSLDLSGSGLSGEIPPFMVNLTNLKSLDLSNNNFTGGIPAYLGELPGLELLNLEGNNLNGPVPRKIIERSQNGTLDLRINNNAILCSTGNFCSASSNNNKKIIRPVVISVSVAAVLLIIGIVAACIWKRRKISNGQDGLVAASTISEKGRQGKLRVKDSIGGFHIERSQFSEADIVTITGNFKNPIGRGGFGTVYHGHLQDGRQVAVKVLSKSSSEAEKQFRAEAELLTRVHHKYLVSLLGFCHESMALVYEFAPLGSLADHLHGNLEGKSILSWSTRIRIAFEAAQGLDYLHNGCKPPIVHRDVKTSNILLMENFEVKFADFGLSRSFDVEANTYASTAIAGTPGYLDPDYHESGRLTEKSDVYSFGIVLLELVTGKPPISSGLDGTHILKDVKSKIERGDLESVADPKFQGYYDVNSMWRVIEIALACSTHNSVERPNISNVALQLRECLAAESSAEFLHRVSPGTSSIISDNSMVGTGPQAR